MDINIIGGADGPTSVFLSSSNRTISIFTIIGIIVACIAVIGIIVSLAKKKKS
ncbi:MAG: sodium ion-translocating decarboxylase subunit beta [Clostridiaceae bacterium]|jgi:Na+-transporting methylmalonyl-CoA/oxaloacetate decarboxylase beta subunit|nr:sodium ion-translocating decarboxylase subunit beta [Clostridiaceae bacterium]